MENNMEETLKGQQENKEYIFMLDKAWVYNTNICKEIPMYCIVNNVERCVNGGYTFTIKGKVQIMHTYYDFAFIEHTEEDLILLEEFKILTKELLNIQEKIQKIRKKFKRVSNYVSIDDADKKEETISK